ncbi:LLM class flavin-dependent oxidoreductase [Rhodococcus sp. NCIMB 12038]|uniref:LLM class flavin-dependent oxidoreductase n=1 Tax=Rhodococcus sp. NCIMB 12038 TaxID=933800 RepID=UPI000B3C8ADA|nr:LLM class flavin-dependent oxidoreductase [Rhodococcus sp. NCIMB 12038]OUS79653.1 hypothetical protein CA951_42500 [Rhodococcus sp. NCIMB 12038]
MKFGLYLNPQTDGPGTDRAILESVTSAAIMADRAGFDAIWLTEHHFTNYNTYGDPFVFGASLAPQLKQAWVVLTVATLALHNPIRFAEQANLLDQLLKGRFIAGYGAGGSGPEFAGFARPVDTRHETMHEVLEIAERAWELEQGEPGFEYRTPFEAGYVTGRIMPSSHRAPRPMLGRGTLSDEGIIETARAGHVLFMGRLRAEQAEEQLRTYENALRAAKFPEAHVDLCLRHSGPVRMLFVADSDDEAYELVQDAIDGYLEHIQAASPADRREREVIGKAPVFRERADLLDRAIIWGGPDKVAAELEKFRSAGLQRFTAWFHWGRMSPERAERSLSTFIDKVLPRFDEPAEDHTLARAVS